MTRCTSHRLQPGVQGQHTRGKQPWALSSSEQKTFHTIKPSVWASTQFHLPIHAWFSLSHGSAALCQCHFTTSHKCVYRLCGPLHFEGLVIFWAESTTHSEGCAHTDRSIWQEIFCCARKGMKISPAVRHDNMYQRGSTDVFLMFLHCTTLIQQNISNVLLLTFVHPPIQLLLNIISRLMALNPWPQIP